MISSEFSSNPSDCNSYFSVFGLYNSLAATSKAILICVLISYPDFSIANKIISIASSLDFKLGANPPSSPTAVFNFFEFNIFFKL